MSTQDNSYQFSFTAINGKDSVALNQFSGKIILIVNTASQCGFTKQYASLEKLYQQYKDQSLIIIGVPSNDFGHQEPDSNNQIQEFCGTHFNVTFPLTQKEHVRGKNAHPFYQWARQKLGFLAAPKWNFHKYLIDQQGRLVDYFYSTTDPCSKKIARAIEALIHKT